MLFAAREVYQLHFITRSRMNKLRNNSHVVVVVVVEVVLVWVDVDEDGDDDGDVDLVVVVVVLVVLVDCVDVEVRELAVLPTVVEETGGGGPGIKFK